MTRARMAKAVATYFEPLRLDANLAAASPYHPTPLQGTPGKNRGYPFGRIFHAGARGRTARTYLEKVKSHFPCNPTKGGFDA